MNPSRFAQYPTARNTPLSLTLEERLGESCGGPRLDPLGLGLPEHIPKQHPAPRHGRLVSLVLVRAARGGELADEVERRRAADSPGSGLVGLLDNVYIGLLFGGQAERRRGRT